MTQPTPLKPCPTMDDDGYLNFNCPNSGKSCCIPIKPEVHPDTGASWQYDKTTQTVTPSINCGGCGWHGFIRNGEYT